MIRALIGMETSGAVRTRLWARGIEAWSVDTLPSVDNSPYHIIGDVHEVLKQTPEGYYSFGLFHPTCTYLTCSAEWAYSEGPYHQRVKPGTLVGLERRRARQIAIKGVQSIWNSGKIQHLAIENPVGVLSSYIGKPTQTIQPYEFGENASKRTCLWTRGLPLLLGTKRVTGRFVDGVERWANQTDAGQNRLSPSEDRWSKRSVTYPGIAKAIAEQWGDFILERSFA